MTPTPRQIELMRHALGLTSNPVPYRDHYVTKYEDADCLALTAAGFMKRDRGTPGGLVYFHVTEAGERIAWHESRPAVFTHRGPCFFKYKVTVYGETPARYRARWEDVDIGRFAKGGVYLLPKDSVAFPEEEIVVPLFAADGKFNIAGLAEIPLLRPLIVPEGGT